MITYSSTTLTNISDGASNLSPFFSHKLTDIYNVENNPNGYWMDNGTSYGWTKNSKFTFTQLEDGWLHVHIDNSSGTATIRNDCCVPKYNPSIKRATKYTFLVEFRNNQSTGVASGSDFYLVQQSGSVQFWGQNITTAPYVRLEGIGNNLSEVPSDGSYVFSRFIKYSEPEGGSSHWTTNEKMVTFTFRASAGAVLDYDVRLSVYEGEYWGNYVPYIISDVTDIRNSAEDANYKIDNLEIGGRNLLLKSDREVSNANYNIITYNLSDKGQELQEGDIITFSMKARILPERQRWAIYNSGSSLNISSWQVITPDGNSDIIYTWTGEWKVNYNGSPVANTKLYVYLGTGSGTENNIIYWAKLEKGHKMTDWTLAPEDIEASIQEYVTSIQSQVDGMAEIHYGTAAPTLSNAPYTSWGDTITRDMHVDDLYYNTSTGYCYRFTKSGSTYSWTRIKDSDITAAATAASNANTAAGNAQTTANNANTLAGQKRRIFVNQPTPPYEVGDLWVEGSNGDIKKCKTARASGSYTASDWELASKYTDDTLANEANDKIDNLEIGGRNLILNTAQERISPASINGSAYVSPTPTCSAYADNILNNIEDEFVYSFDYEVTGNTATDGYVYTQIRGTQTANTDGKVSINIYNNPIGKYVHVFKLSSSQASGTSLSAGIRLRYASDGAILTVRNIKLEKGNKATDWTPAPEDTQTDIDTALAQSIWYATCSTAGATLLKEATITPATTNFKLGIGTAVNIKFDNTNSGARTSLTLNVNNTGAKNIKFINNNTITDIPGNGYILGGRTYLFIYDGTYWVIQNLNYNTNETNHILNNFSGKTGELGIWQTGLFMKDGSGTYQNICTDSSGNITRTNANTKKANTKGFEIGSSIYFSPNNTYAANANITGAVYASYGVFDSRYSLNAEGANALTAYMPIYLTGTINDVDGLFHLDTVWWTQTPTDSNKVYVLIGGCYDYYHATSADYWRITLYEQNSWYKYVDGVLVDYSNNLAELAATTATAFIAVDTDNNGIMIHPEDDMSSGWQIGTAINLVKGGLNYLKLWFDNLTAKIRIGNEEENHLLIDNEGLYLNGVENNEIKELAAFKSTGISFNNETPYKIGNDDTYIKFEDTNNDGKADKLSIVADSISFADSNETVQAQLENLQNGFDSIQNNNYIRIIPSEPSITIAADSNESISSLKLTSDKLSFMVQDNEIAYMANDQMDIPTASVTNLFMQSANDTYEKLWVMRSNGHLSLKTVKKD